MKKSIILYILMWGALSFVYIMDGSYEMGFVLLLLFSLFLLGAFSCFLSGKELYANIKLPYSMDKEQEGTGIITIKNGSFWPVFRGRIKLVCENNLTGEREIRFLPFALMPKGKAELYFKLQSEYCGECVCVAEEIRVYDLLALFSGKRELAGRYRDKKEEKKKKESHSSKARRIKGSILVFPKAETIEMSFSDRDAYDMESFRYSNEKKGDDPSETFAIREYRRGDSMGRIHWKLTGKLDQIMVKESSFPIFNSMMLLLETGYEEGKRPDKEAMHAALEVCVSLGEMLCRRNTPFELGYYDYEKELFYSQRVEGIEELWSLVPGLLRAGRRAANQSAYYQSLLQINDKKFAHYMYVAPGDAFPELDMAAETDSITVLRCAAEPKREGDHITYTSSNWKEELF